jgi:glycosyltransferase involved in cell wall biosynthesis
LNWKVIDFIDGKLRHTEDGMNSWVYYEYYSEKNKIVNRGYVNTILDAEELQLLSDRVYPMPFPVDNRWLAGDYDSSEILIMHSSAIDMTGDTFATDRASFKRYKNILKKFDYYVGRTVWEANRVVPQFAENCNQMDEIHTQSNFCKQAFEDSGVTVPIHVLPNGIDLNTFYPEVDETFSFGKNIDKRFKFFGIADCHMQNTYRKGIDVLLYSYLKEFSYNDDTILILKTNLAKDRFNFMYEKILKELHKTEKEAPPIHILPNAPLSYADMRKIYNAVQCYIMPTRGEGFGIPYAEALACQTPVIATDYGGHRDFLTPANSYLIECDGWTIVGEEQFGDLYHYHGLEFPEPSIESSTAQMRKVYDGYYQAKKLAKKGFENIHNNYNAKETTHNFLNQLETI